MDACIALLYTLAKFNVNNVPVVDNGSLVTLRPQNFKTGQNDKFVTVNIVKMCFESFGKCL